MAYAPHSGAEDNQMMKQGIVVCACAVLVATSARAQDEATGSKSSGAAEITPYVLLGSNSSSGVGASVRWPLVSQLSAELDTSYRRGEIGALNLNFSLLFDLPRVGRVTPYLAGGVGLEQYGTAEVVTGSLAPPATVSAANVVTRERTALSVNAGGGIRVRGDQNWGVRTDARWSNGIGWMAPERWRLYNGVTFGRQSR